jgi:hypothetical protein
MDVYIKYNYKKTLILLKYIKSLILNFSMVRTEACLMSNNSKLVLGLAVVVVLALFVMIFMGLGEKLVTVPRAPL